jgi:hypothetical protein
MSGLKMMKRTGGIEEFEFIGLADALAIISKNKEKRLLARQKKGMSDTRQEEIEIQKDINDILDNDRVKVTSQAKEHEPYDGGDVLWEINPDDVDKPQSPNDTDVIGTWADLGSKESLNEAANVTPELENVIKDPIPLKSRQTNVLITVAGWVSYDTVIIFNYRTITHILTPR